MKQGDRGRGGGTWAQGQRAVLNQERATLPPGNMRRHFWFSQLWPGGGSCGHTMGRGHSFLQRFYLFIFRERVKKGEREGEEHRCVRETSGTGLATQAYALTGNQTGNLMLSRATPARVPLNFHNVQDSPHHRERCSPKCHRRRGPEDPI